MSRVIPARASAALLTQALCWSASMQKRRPVRHDRVEVGPMRPSTGEQDRRPPAAGDECRRTGLREPANALEAVRAIGGAAQVAAQELQTPGDRMHVSIAESGYHELAVRR